MARSTGTALILHFARAYISTEKGTEVGCRRRKQIRSLFIHQSRWKGEAVKKEESKVKCAVPPTKGRCHSGTLQPGRLMSTVMVHYLILKSALDYTIWRVGTE